MCTNKRFKSRGKYLVSLVTNHDLLISDPSGLVTKAQNDKKLDARIKITAAEPHELSSFKAAVTKAPCQEDLLPTDISTSANVA
ncbi:hypothetical protein FQA39_LY05983 [Lamprigera yunnana]|nr:hypothetical protein FQA39_LY05983 [Lamprigera yunnana]